VSNQPLRLSLDCERLVADILERTQKFPRTERYGLGDRIDNTALDLATLLADARFTSGPRRRAALEEINLRLHRLRVLLRLAHTRKALATNALEHITRQLDELGASAGAWRERLSPGRDRE